MMDSNLVGPRLFALRKELLSLSRSATEHFCKMGEIMREIHDNELWRGQYESFEAFFSDPEFSFRKSSVYHAMRLVEVFPAWQELRDVPVSKLIMVVPHLREDNREELVSKARSLSSSDLNFELGLQGSSNNVKPLPKIYECLTCHGVKGVSFDDLCHCSLNLRQAKLVSEAISKIERTI